MKPIEGVQLNELVQKATQEILSERQKGVQELIKSKLNELNQSTAKINDLERQLAKEKHRAEKLQSWLSSVREGNWDVLDLSEKAESKNKEGKNE